MAELMAWNKFIWVLGIDEGISLAKAKFIAFYWVFDWIENLNRFFVKIFIQSCKYNYQSVLIIKPNMSIYFMVI